MIAGAVLLFLFAGLLVAGELFLPTHGVMGLMAILCALGSVIMAYRVSPALGFFFGLAVVIMAPFAFYWAVRLYPKSIVGKRVMLDAPSVPAPTTPTSSLGELVGQRGVAMTTLRPAGAIELDGRRIDALSESEVIDAGKPVEVIRVVGMKVIVKPLG